MNAHPLLIAAGLLFWGSQAGFLPYAAAMGLALEGSRLARRRLEVTRAAYARLSDLCTLFFAGVVIYSYALKEGTSAIMNVLEWLPFCLFPLLAAQAYSAQGEVDLGAFFWTLRKRGGEAGSPMSVDMSYGYLALCVLSASAANVRAPGFYAGMAALCGWALWRAGRNAAARLLLFCLAAVLGYAGHVALHEFQSVVELKAAELVFGKARVRMSPYRSDTAIGRIGELKRSDRIVLRVAAPRGRSVPHLLRESSFDLYKASSWYAHDARFSDAAPAGAEGSWKLSEGAGKASSIRVCKSLPGGEGLLAVPGGAFRIDDLPAAALGRNRFGALKVEGSPGFAEYGVRYAEGDLLEGPPTAEDVLLPGPEKPLFARIVSERGWKGLPAGIVVDKVGRYFRDGFSYSVYQDAGRAGRRPLEDFLLRTRSGHCEYYATATALLLRAAGVPARYATGYSVQEYGRFEKAFLVRQKHAHAWVLAYVDGAWRDLDTTPPSWVEAEEAAGAWGRPVRDILSWCGYRFSKWRWSRTKGDYGRYALIASLALAAFALWRLFRRLKLAREMEQGAKRPSQGMDSEFFEIEKALAKRGLGRHPYEPSADWLKRLASSHSRTEVGRLRPLLELHNRHRFDPDGLTGAEREALRRGVLRWLAKAS